MLVKCAGRLWCMYVFMVGCSVACTMQWFAVPVLHSRCCHIAHGQFVQQLLLCSPDPSLAWLPYRCLHIFIAVLHISCNKHLF